MRLGVAGADHRARCRFDLRACKPTAGPERRVERLVAGSWQPCLFESQWAFSMRSGVRFAGWPTLLNKGSGRAGTLCSKLALVPKSAKTPHGVSSGSSKPEDLPFEKALEKLESIVDAMESDDLPLETLLNRFEEGTQLVRLCRKKLDEAELKIQQLEKAGGETILKQVAPDAASSDEGEEENEADIEAGDENEE